MLTENALADTAPVHNGQLYVSDGVVKISTIGLNPDGTGGPAKTIADLKTLWSATKITTCDYASRVGGVFLATPGISSVEIFET